MVGAVVAAPVAGACVAGASVVGAVVAAPVAGACVAGASVVGAPQAARSRLRTNKTLAPSQILFLKVFIVPPKQILL